MKERKNNTQKKNAQNTSKLFIASINTMRDVCEFLVSIQLQNYATIFAMVFAHVNCGSSISGTVELNRSTGKYCDSYFI